MPGNIREQFKDQRKLLQDLRNRLRGDLDDTYDFIKGVSVEMAGRRLAKLARYPGLTVTEDVAVRLAADDASLWPAASGILPLHYFGHSRLRRRSRSSTPASTRTAPTSGTAPA